MKRGHLIGRLCSTYLLANRKQASEGNSIIVDSLKLTHSVDSVLENKGLALDRNGNLLAEITVCDSRADRGNVTHLLRVSDSHGVEMADEFLPDTVFVHHFGLDTELALDTLGSDLDDFLCKVGKLSDHFVDGGDECGFVA